MIENKLHNEDCLETMSRIDDNSIDSVICDPPYELGFMNKQWDNTGISYNVDLWREVLRIMKPGAYLLAFGGSRTYHRLACAIENAGFEIRDCIAWIYCVGFPKSLNIGKTVDKLQGNERKELGIYDGRSKYDGADRKQRDEDNRQISTGKDKIAITNGTSEWEGWGTALKPAHEPICVARKPLSEKTVAENVLKYKTGAINIDESRIDIDNNDNIYKKNPHTIQKTKSLFFDGKKQSPEYQISGRFPSNLIHDGSDEIVREFSKAGYSESKGFKDRDKCHSEGKNAYILSERHGISYYPQDSGSAARFFKVCPFEEEDFVPFKYCAKASASERDEGLYGVEPKKINAGYYRDGLGNAPRINGEKFTAIKNNHPCVKPVKLMKYLITLVTHKDGIIYDPFAGSGSTLVAAAKLGYKFIGSEIDSEYCTIANKRIDTVLKQRVLF